LPPAGMLGKGMFGDTGLSPKAFLLNLAAPIFFSTS
jgi:hypothetical protein